MINSLGPGRGNVPDGYEIVDTPFPLRFWDWSPSQAKEFFEWFVTNIPTRLAILTRTLNVARSRGGADSLRLDESPASFVALGRWLADNASERPVTVAEMLHYERLPEMESIGIPDPTTVDDAKTLSLCFDAGIYLAETLRHRHPHLSWTYVREPKNAFDYNCPVLDGFRELGRLDGYQVVQVTVGTREDDCDVGSEFLRVFTVWDAYASPIR